MSESEEEYTSDYSTDEDNHMSPELTSEEDLEQRRAKAQKLKDEGNRYYSMKDYDRAVDHFRAAIELYPDEPAFYGNLAAACLQLKRYNKALLACKRAIELDPKFIKAYLRAGRAYAQMGKFVDAKHMFEQALKVE